MGSLSIQGSTLRQKASEILSNQLLFTEPTNTSPFSPYHMGRQAPALANLVAEIGGVKLGLPFASAKSFCGLKRWIFNVFMRTIIFY